MSDTQDKGTFQKVGECLYRLSSSGKYYALVKHGGKQHRQCLRTTDAKYAKRLLAEFRRKLERTNPAGRKTTLAQLCDRYVATLGRLDINTVVTRTAIIKRLRNTWPDGEQVLVPNIKPSDVLAWIGTQGKRVKTATLNEYIRVVRQLFGIALKDRIIADSPAVGLKEGKREKPIRETPTWEQFKQIVETIRENKLSDTAEVSADLVEFMGLAGLGNAEADGLRWRDVDLTAGTIRVFRKKTEQGFVIPIYPQLRPFVEGLKEKAEKAGTFAQDQKLFAVASAKKALATACKKLGFENYTHRAFRRMFITRAIELGIDVKVIAELQGHRDGGKLILQTYSHVSRPHLEEMVKKLTDVAPTDNAVGFRKNGK